MDTSPAAIKAWALSKAADIDNLSSEIRTWLGDDAGDEYEKDGKADDAPDAAMFRAVAALAARAEADSDGGWRGMDSAPKGDTLSAAAFLVWCPDERASGGGEIRVVWWEPEINGGCWYCDGQFAVEPTHWRPLPAPPQENDDAGR